ncbi:RlpA-like double-psi beta-barrel-protein domain-containing protein-containing protein [Apodospora peruviana]|uniref:cellulase n=1 Tax=Apodospora peruviana TaxID=516989 RepID=A0AAE0I5D6_9PEZI|nr:RlpA-like double-psi beta-barrel-protein domain-containing protein-containing protein [Apodospora peruviana]
MWWTVLYAAALLASHNVKPVRAINAKSYTGWDCCKPICAEVNGKNNLLNSRGVATVCNKNNEPQGRDAGVRASSGCANGGSAFLCDTYQPIPVADDLSYGFAIQISDGQTGDNANCCKCHQVTWTTGAAVNKSMIVQIITPGGAADVVKKNDLIILTPGGGLGPLSSGCANQYGKAYSWGENKGGVKNREACEKIPGNLQGGCYWRFNWARGEINGWDITYNQVSCPSILTDISGCSA